MSGLDYVSTSNAPRDRYSMPQGQVVASFSPLLSHDTVRAKGAMSGVLRPKIDKTQYRIEVGDVLFVYNREGLKFQPEAYDNLPKAFATHAGAPYEMEQHTSVIGIAETAYITGNMQEAKLQSHSIRRVYSQRLRGQRRGTHLQVDYGCAMVAVLPTLEDDRENLIDWLPETTRSNFVARDLPLIEPLQKYTNQSVDCDVILDRAIADVLASFKSFRTMTSDDMLGEKKKRRPIAYDVDTNADNSTVWDNIDNELVKMVSLNLANMATPAFAKYLLNPSETDMHHLTEQSFTRDLNIQLYSMLSQCSTVDDYINAQQFAIQLQLVLTHFLYNSANPTSEKFSKFLLSGQIYSACVSHIMMLGQDLIETKCKKLIGMALESGQYRDNVDIWLQPHAGR